MAILYCLFFYKNNSYTQFQKLIIYRYMAGKSIIKKSIISVTKNMKVP